MADPSRFEALIKTEGFHRIQDLNLEEIRQHGIDTLREFTVEVDEIIGEVRLSQRRHDDEGDV